MYRSIVLAVLAGMLVACGAAQPAATGSNSSATTVPVATAVATPADSTTTSVETTAPAATASAEVPSSATTVSTETPPPATTAETTATMDTASTAVPAAELKRVGFGLGYIPNVQFAPFYVAAAKGYYAAEGLDVDFTYGGNVNDLLIQVASGKLPFAIAAGDEVLMARAQQIPVEMAFLMYQQFPVAVFSKQAAGIVKPADLRGKTIGVPGHYGATYIGLLGLLQTAGLTEADVTINDIGFTQFEAVSQDKVPAAVGYANNEPLRMADAGEAVNTIKVADYIKLVSNGIVVGESFAAQDPETVRKFVQATRKGLEATLANPDEAFAISLKHIPELAADQQPFQRKVLAETLGYWKTADTDKEGLGWLNPPAWDVTYTFLRQAGILQHDTDATKAYTQEFLTPGQ